MAKKTAKKTNAKTRKAKAKRTTKARKTTVKRTTRAKPVAFYRQPIVVLSSGVDRVFSLFK